MKNKQGRTPLELAMGLGPLRGNRGVSAVPAEAHESTVALLRKLIAGKQ